jgi:hypothetical protein
VLLRTLSLGLPHRSLRLTSSELERVMVGPRLEGRDFLCLFLLLLLLLLLLFLPLQKASRVAPAMMRVGLFGTFHRLRFGRTRWSRLGGFCDRWDGRKEGRMNRGLAFFQAAGGTTPDDFLAMALVGFHAFFFGRGMGILSRVNMVQRDGSGFRSWRQTDRRGGGVGGGSAVHRLSVIPAT